MLVIYLCGNLAIVLIFSSGRRVAELEMHVLLAQLIKNFKIEYREYKPIEFIIKLFNRPERQVDLAFIDV